MQQTHKLHAKFIIRCSKIIRSGRLRESVFHSFGAHLRAKFEITLSLAHWFSTNKHFPRGSTYGMRKSLKIKANFISSSLLFSACIRSLSFQRNIKSFILRGDATALSDCRRNIYDSRLCCVRRKRVEWILILHFEFITKRRSDKLLILIDFMLETGREREFPLSVTSYFKACNNRLAFTI